SHQCRLLILAAVAALTGYASVPVTAQQPAKPSPLDEHIQQLAQDAPLLMRFRGKTAKECRQWQEAFAKKLQTLLGPYQPPTSWEGLVESTVNLADHNREELLLKAKGHPPLPLYLLVPLGKESKSRPGIVAVHGHGNFGYDAVVGRELTPGIEPEVKQSNYD